jgi:hypothetical protein
MPKKNENKTVSVSATGITVFYTDSNKHYFVKFEKTQKPVAKQKKQYLKTEESVFNNKQQKMYLEALYGLSIYPEEVIRKMPTTVVTKIISRCQIVQKTINRWKQEIVNEKVDNLLLALFPKSPVIKSIIGIEPDDFVKCKFSSKEVGLNQEKIAKRLISLNLLPVNFFDL